MPYLHLKIQDQAFILLISGGLGRLWTYLGRLCLGRLSVSCDLAALMAVHKWGWPLEKGEMHAV